MAAKRSASLLKLPVTITLLALLISTAVTGGGRGMSDGEVIMFSLTGFGNFDGFFTNSSKECLSHLKAGVSTSGLIYNAPYDSYYLATPTGYIVDLTKYRTYEFLAGCIRNMDPSDEDERALRAASRASDFKDEDEMAAQRGKGGFNDEDEKVFRKGNFQGQRRDGFRGRSQGGSKSTKTRSLQLRRRRETRRLKVDEDDDDNQR
ncbi:uncharacterized protein A4U43_C06F14880 [Asparagus officinalis]|uniref:Uncharacterized protein n=1 Tax=Asparagus officinalis TaxID=4686 RepID=A0A5P1EML3_ASPOF|nr:uncharacterized protein A4U43_C06F14880 [Asparagus officinalis]